MKYTKVILPLLLLGCILVAVGIKCQAVNNIDPPASPTPKLASWQLGSILTEQQVRDAGTDSFFKVETISDALFERMQKGGSFPKGCTTKRSDLCYLKLLHYNYKGQIVCGEMVCNRLIAEDTKEAFKELFIEKYQIERMVLIDDYHADDDNSMLDNNTSCFCFRKVDGTQKMSYHAKGLAIDINPLHNPWVKRNAKGSITMVQPDCPEARKYANRSAKLPHIINTSDLCYKVFHKHGFTWGGSWKHSKDYQHFEKRL